MSAAKKMSKGAIALAAVSIASMALAGCSSANTEADPVAADCVPTTEGLTTIKDGTLTVGVPENPPITMTSGDDADGFEIDVIRLLAESECLTLDFVPITYGNGIPMVSQQKSVDVITGGWYVTEDRAKQVGFTVPTFYDAMAIVSADGATTIADLESIGTVGSGTGYSWEADMQKVLGDKLKSYPGPVEMKQDFDAGRIDAVLEGFAPATNIFADSKYKVVAAEADERVKITIDRPVMAFPISKDNPELGDALSVGIEALRADGTLAEIMVNRGLQADFVVPADVAAKSIR